MAVIDKANVPPPTLPKEVADVPELGGKVVLRGLLLNDRIRILNLNRNGGARVSDMLACTVVDAHDEPIYTVQQWEEFGASNFKVCLDLFARSRALSGLDAEVNEKKS